MKKIILIFLTASIFLMAKDMSIFAKKNVLYVQNLIKLEESIAQEYENYILNEFKIPSLADLITDDYLGSNFSVKNQLGANISLESANELKIKFAVTKKLDTFIYDLYKRDLYRHRTTAFTFYSPLAFSTGRIDPAKSYVSFELITKEAENIFALLKSGSLINKDCSGLISNRYCSKNSESIRWYDDSSNWIEYDKKDFNLGNVTVKNMSLIDDCKTNTRCKLNDLAVGSYVYVQNGAKFIKTLNSLNEVK